MKKVPEVHDVLNRHGFVEPEVLSIKLHGDWVGRSPVSKVRDRGVPWHEVGEDERHHRNPKAEKHQRDEASPYEEKEGVLRAALCERRSQ
jgi:hypothetical protein